VITIDRNSHLLASGRACPGTSPTTRSRPYVRPQRRSPAETVANRQTDRRRTGCRATQECFARNHNRTDRMDALWRRSRPNAASGSFGATSQCCVSRDIACGLVITANPPTRISRTAVAGEGDSLHRCTANALSGWRWCCSPISAHPPEAGRNRRSPARRFFVQYFWIESVWPPTPTSSSVFCRCW
jgi:hypothetical protein